MFAVSAFALLAATLWMLAADHYRGWKVYQRTYLDRVEPWLTEAQLRRETTAEFAAAEEELNKAIDATLAEVPARDSIDRFCEEVGLAADARQRTEADEHAARIQSAYEALVAAPGQAARQNLLAQLDEPIQAAQLRLQNADRELRFAKATFDEARSSYESGVGRRLSPAQLSELKREADEFSKEVDRKSDLARHSSAACDRLTEIHQEITRNEDNARQELADHRAELARLERSLDQQRVNLAKRTLRLPLIDAFGRPLEIRQIWLPELTIDYNFRRVARFDRCVTCHQAIDKTSPGEPTVPACRTEQVLAIMLETPAEAPPDDGPDAGEPAAANRSPLETLYGFTLAPEGILEPTAPTVGLVLPETAAARAGLMAGDVITIGGGEINSRAGAIRALTEDVDWGQPLALEIRRGLPHPFSSHPRLDLFVGSLSPHPMAEFGCTICHEGQGSATEFKFASHAPDSLRQRSRWRTEHDWFFNEHWDFPMLPDRFSESGCLKCHHDVVDLEPSGRFVDPPAPKLVAGYHLVRKLGCFGCHEINGVDNTGRRTGPDMRIEPDYHLASSNSHGSIGSTPGTMRKVGPTLRGVGDKLDGAFVDQWIANPAAFRAETRMPRFFGLHEHLDGQMLDEAKRFEGVEIHSVTEYLLASSEPVELVDPPSEVNQPPDAERGRRLFKLHGCLACHKHADFPEAGSTFAPDLSYLGSKLGTEAGRRWLAAWIRNPASQSPRTLMPNPMLQPETISESTDDESAESKESTPGVTDPAADIAAYLLASSGTPSAQRRPPADSDLDQLAAIHLSEEFPGWATDRVARYVAEGIPESLAAQLEGDAIELSAPVTPAARARYVGRRTIRKRGCFGCHDIPGFESAQPIGPALSDWGRKHESLLAFEQIHRFIDESHDTEAEPSAGEADADREFFEHALRSHRREGFIWQKLRRPRSFDYEKIKSYNEQLTMGRFSLTPEEREQVITFVLGLVSDPPAERYVYQPDRRQEAIVEGRRVLDTYGCAQCHTLEMERWTFEFDPDEYEPPFAMDDFEFLKPHFTADQVAKSLATDDRGLSTATVIGMPRVDAYGELIEDFDYDDNPLFFFTLFEPAVIAGEICPVGGADVLVSEPQLVAKRPPLGGAFARLLFPWALEEGRAAGATASELEGWGWVPPPLEREGRMVRPDWLYDYMLAPYQVRPAALLRMPDCNLSPVEAARLVDYFAASSGAEFPYTSNSLSSSLRGQSDRPDSLQRMDDAMRLLTDRTTYCGKCHLIGDFSPGGESWTVLAPNLDAVGRRIRPDYLRRWLGNPKSALPYTAMPVNFPPAGEAIGQDLLPGSSVEQIDAVVELLLNYDSYLKRRMSIQAMIEAAEAEPPATSGQE